MKYRIQLFATFNNTDSNDILDEVETIKTNVYDVDHYTEVDIIRKAKKLEYNETDDSDFIPIEYDNVDFDAGEITHSDVPTGIVEFDVDLDISFSDSQKYYDFLNYIETIKGNAKVGSSYIRHCRFFECRHDETTIPLPKDGSYSYIDFDGSELTHPV